MSSLDKSSARMLSLSAKLRKMKLSAMADEMERQSADPNAGLIDPLDRIEKLILSEWDLRRTKKLSRFKKAASLRYPEASIDASIHDPQRLLDAPSIEALSTCQWIEEGKNLLVTGSAGTGKTYVVNALCVSAINQFKTVKYSKASHMISELESASVRGEELQMIKEMSQIDLLVLDDFGLMDLDPDKCRRLFELVDSREGRKSTVIISQLPVSSWYSLFKDATYADSCMDRLVHNAYRLDFRGKNMRNPSLTPRKEAK
ncbi:MAG: ATP-binding protein [Bacilli bacterium]|nr:ATP-binding protein [Bacilli bacterium]